MSTASSAALALAFYNGRDHGTWLDRAIARHDSGGSAGPFSHAELVFNPGAARADLCFSSSWRDGGVRFKRIDLHAPPVKWELVALPVPHADAALVRAWCLRHLGGRYDLPGVLAFKLPLVRHRLNWWFCSEVCVAALQQAGLFDGLRPHRISPNRLYHLARRLKLATAHV